MHILHLLKQHGIPTRSKSEARTLALERGKLAFDRNTAEGSSKRVVLERQTLDRFFFKSWSPAMAYVLGVIYTDGSLHPGRAREPGAKTTPTSPRVSVSQKEPELLLKVLALLGSNARLMHSEKRGISGALYFFHLNGEEVYQDLLNLGLTARKSLTIQFPPMPVECIRHFVRGCWDGDGSVYVLRDRPSSGTASYLSGSRRFVDQLNAALHSLGLPLATIHTDRRSGASYIKYHGRNCVRLFHLLYDGVDETTYLSRKYSRFKQIADWFEAKDELVSAPD